MPSYHTEVQQNSELLFTLKGMLMYPRLIQMQLYSDKEYYLKLELDNQYDEYQEAWEDILNRFHT